MVTRLRGGCIEYKKAQDFNNFLQAAADDTKGSQPDFWMSIEKDRIGLISSSDCTGGASEEESQSFYKTLPSEEE